MDTLVNKTVQYYYAGVGSRKTPRPILVIMEMLGEELGKMGFILRSGGAIGADRAFEKGADKGGYQKEIFYAEDCTQEGMEMAKIYHPAWSTLSDYAKQLHGRNALQICGKDLHSPVDFIVCWTPDGCTRDEDRSAKTGGTGTAISIASNRQYPVFNLRLPGQVEKVLEFANHLKKYGWRGAPGSP